MLNQGCTSESHKEMYTCVPIWAFLPGKCLSLSSRLWTVPYYSVLSDSLWPHGLQLTRLPYTSPSPKACWNSYPLSWWYHPTISSFVLLPSIFPSIRVFSSESVLHIRRPKYWSFMFSINPSNEYSGLISFMIDWFDSLQSKGLSRVFSNTTVQKHQFFCAQLSL